MMNEVKLMPPVERYIKKLKDKKLVKLFRDEIELIRNNPEVGQVKTGDLNGVYTRGFRYQKADYRIAYRVRVADDGSLIIVIMIGVRENFYDDLKNYINEQMKNFE